MGWQAGFVLGVLLLAWVTVRLFKSLPSDLIYALAALSTTMVGIVPAKQIMAAATSQTILALLGVSLITDMFKGARILRSWIGSGCVAFGLLLLLLNDLCGARLLSVPVGTLVFLGALCLFCVRRMPWARVLPTFAWDQLLVVFSAFLFFHAMHQSQLDAWLALHLPQFLLARPYALGALFFCLAWAVGYVAPRPLVLACLFSVALACSERERISLLVAGLSGLIGTTFSLVPVRRKPEIFMSIIGNKK